MQENNILDNIKSFIVNNKVLAIIMLFLVAILSFYKLGLNLGEFMYYVQK